MVTITISPPLSTQTLKVQSNLKPTITLQKQFSHLHRLYSYIILETLNYNTKSHTLSGCNGLLPCYSSSLHPLLHIINVISTSLWCLFLWNSKKKRLQEFLGKGSFYFFSLASRSQLWGHCALYSLSCGSYSDTASLHASGKGQIRHMLARWALAFPLHLYPPLSPPGTQLIPQLLVTGKAFHALDYCLLHGHTSSYRSRISPPINSNATHRWKCNVLQVTSIYQVLCEEVRCPHNAKGLHCENELKAKTERGGSSERPQLPLSDSQGIKQLPVMVDLIRVQSHTNMAWPVGFRNPKIWHGTVE